MELHTLFALAQLPAAVGFLDERNQHSRWQSIVLSRWDFPHARAIFASNIA